MIYHPDASIFVRDLEAHDQENCLSGSITLWGVNFHVTGVQVETVGDMQKAVNDPHKRLDDIYAMDPEGIFQTVRLDDFEGEWVVGISPYK
jgi:hypothetical protein